MNCVVFLGPSAPRQEVEKRLEAAILPPAAQGDIHRAARSGARFIGLVDGYFEGVPSVWHKEILWAMSQGIHVFGASSMGALRAAELHSFGMRGVGKIFEAYKSGTIEDDDEVAVTHSPPEAGYVALSEAMVNVRSTLERAQQDGVVDPETRAALEDLAKRIFYQDRTWESLLDRAEAEEVGLVSIHVLRGWLVDRKVDQKRIDALAMADAMQLFMEGEPEPMAIDFDFQHTAMWEEAVSAGWTTGLSSRPEAGETIHYERVLEELRLRPGEFAAARRRALGRLLALREAERRSVMPDPESTQDERNRFRLERGLLSRHALDQWLIESDFDAPAFDRLMADEVRIAALESEIDQSLGEQILADLRLRGDYAELAARARAKQRRLSEIGKEEVSLADVEVELPELLAWYFEQRLGKDLPERPDALLEDWGLSDMDALCRLLLREFLFSTDNEKSSARQSDA